MKINFRPAIAIDCEAIVPLMYESSKELMDYTFTVGKKTPLEYLKFEYQTEKGFFTAARQFVATNEQGEIVATATAYPGGDAMGMTAESLSNARKFFGWVKLATYMIRCIPLNKLFISPDKDSLFLANICVRQDYRGQGLFTNFHRYLEDLARSLELKTMQLDVSFPNQKAQKLYERLGYKITGERPYEGKKKLVGFRRMQRPVQRA